MPELHGHGGGLLLPLPLPRAAKAMGAPPQPSPAISIVVGTLTTASSREVQRKRETGPNLEKTCCNRDAGLLRILEKTVSHGSNTRTRASKFKHSMERRMKKGMNWRR